MLTRVFNVTTYDGNTINNDNRKKKLNKKVVKFTQFCKF